LAKAYEAALLGRMSTRERNDVAGGIRAIEAALLKTNRPQSTGRGY
jgi:hypothetical protein